MLFLESKTLNHPLDTTARLTLLQDLQERNLVPLIRSQRLRSFEDVLLGGDHIREMETATCSPSTTTSSSLSSKTATSRVRSFVPASSTKRTRPNLFESSTRFVMTFAVF